MSILDLFKSQHYEPADVDVEDQPFDFLSSEAKRPSITEMTAPGVPGEITDEKFPWIARLFNTAVPSSEYFETNALLAQILDNLQSTRQNTVPTDFMRPKSVLIPALAANDRFQWVDEDISPYGYVLVPNNKNTTVQQISVYLGDGLAIPLVSKASIVSRAVILQVPNVDRLTFVIDTTGITTPFTLTYILSTRPIKVDVLNVA